MKSLVLFLITLTFSLSVIADARYNSDQNVVSISDTRQSGSDLGFITIYNEKHIMLRIFGLRDGELAAMCGKEPSMGAILFLDGTMKFGVKTPDVTSTEPFGEEEDDAFNNAGYVYAYVFKGDDAHDIMDLLYEYRQVGFAFSNKNCQGKTEAILTVNFKTRGLESAMSRLKE